MKRALIKTRKQKETIFFNIFCKVVLSWAGVIRSFHFTLMLLVVIQTAIAVLLFPVIVSTTSLLSTVSPEMLFPLYLFLFSHLYQLFFFSLKSCPSLSPVILLFFLPFPYLLTFFSSSPDVIFGSSHTIDNLFVSLLGDASQHLCSSPVQAGWQVRVSMIPKVKKKKTQNTGVCPSLPVC